MSDYIAYHNPEAMQYPASEVVGFGILTNKRANEAMVGSTVWLLTGEGKPRRYFLVQRFVAERVESGAEQGFVTHVSAATGHSFQPMIPLSDEQWFPDFLRSQANFSLGFRPIQDERFARGLRAAAAREVAAPSLAPLVEGAITSMTITTYERNPLARQQCLKHYGTSCFACGFSFSDTYGESITGCIHVHHLEPVSTRGGQYVVDPIEDLRPVCPNCHAVLHLKQPPLSIKELKTMIENA